MSDAPDKPESTPTPTPPPKPDPVPDPTPDNQYVYEEPKPYSAPSHGKTTDTTEP